MLKSDSYRRFGQTQEYANAVKHINSTKRNAKLIEQIKLNAHLHDHEQKQACEMSYTNNHSEIYGQHYHQTHGDRHIMKSRHNSIGSGLTTIDASHTLDTFPYTQPHGSKLGLTLGNAPKYSSSIEFSSVSCNDTHNSHNSKKLDRFLANNHSNSSENCGMTLGGCFNMNSSNTNPNTTPATKTNNSNNNNKNSSSNKNGSTITYVNYNQYNVGMRPSQSKDIGRGNYKRSPLGVVGEGMVGVGSVPTSCPSTATLNDKKTETVQPEQLTLTIVISEKKETDERDNNEIDENGKISTISTTSDDTVPKNVETETHGVATPNSILSQPSLRL